MDTLKLPVRPNLARYETRARDLVVAKKADKAQAIRLIKCHHPRLRKLSEAQMRKVPFTLRDAQLVLARAHRFDNWSDFARHIKDLNDSNSDVARFEAAVDAIVAGDTAKLRGLLERCPNLVSVRSTRMHHPTLLHYVGANGVESYRQRSPATAVKIAETLIRAGAEIDAMADMYGGATALGLVATSVHPVIAGVQTKLLTTLLKHGADIDCPRAAGNGQFIVNGCLANGRPGAAEFLARHRARLDLEAAAGVGRLDVARRFFDHNGKLKNGATTAQMKSGFNWACAYGRTSVVEFLLPQGIRLAECHRGETGLHWAAYGGHLEIVRLLLEHGAPVDVKDETWDNTPLGWAVHGWENPSPEFRRPRHLDVIALLIAAGAIVEPRWQRRFRAAPRNSVK